MSLLKLLGGKRNVIPLADIVEGHRVVLVDPPQTLRQSAIENWCTKGLLVLDPRHIGKDVREATIVRRHYSRLKDVYTNNCDVAVLDANSARILAKKQKFQSFATVLVPDGLAWLGTVSGLLRYRARGEIAIAGETHIPAGDAHLRYTVLEIKLRAHSMRRQYGPAGLMPIDILHTVSDLDAVLLRNSNAIADNSHSGDIDLLVSAAAAEPLRSRFEATVGTYPIDVYTSDGSGGYTHSGAPYYSPTVANRIIASSYINEAGIRVPSTEWQFLSYVYHLVFHGKLRPGADARPLSERSFRNPANFAELVRTARRAGRTPPVSVEDMERVLREADAWPSLDLIGFYAKSDTFLKQRYFSHREAPPGLVTFFLRDFDLGPDAIAKVRRALQRNFEILAEGPVTESIRDGVRHGVRGGNWSDKNAGGGKAEAIYWFVCGDHAPKRPSFYNRRKYPGLDNDNVRVKDTIRSELGTGQSKASGVLHSSDNSGEALEHIARLGLKEEPRILAFLKANDIQFK